jgi:hypothetical protein
MHVFFLVLQKDFIKNKTRQYKSYKTQQLNPDSGIYKEKTEH